MYETDGEKFFSKLRGSFSGAVYDKRKEKLIVFSDQIGSRFIYYAKEGDSFICSSMMPEMYHIMKTNNIEYNLSKTGAICLLTYGYMLDDITLCDEVRKIIPGDYLIYENGKVKTATYYTIKKNINEKITEEEAIELLDNTFRKVIKNHFDKDIEYGYTKHSVSLSAGLDSRMVTWVAHNLGYVNQVNTTFSQTGYWDETVPKQIAADLKHEWIFKSLDNGLWLKEMDRIISQTGGNCIYSSSAHGDSFSRYMNREELGVGHSGQLGEMLKGDYIVDKNPYDTKSLPNLKLREYEDNEIMLMYQNGFNFGNTSKQNGSNYNESLSPFLDIDFINAVFTIPQRLRKNAYIYRKWILEKYPKAANYVWEKIECKITDPKIKIAGREIPIKQVLPKILNKIKKQRGIDSIHHMNPIGYYLKHNKDLMSYLEGYFEYKNFITDKDLLKIIERIENKGTNMGKIRLVTLYSAIKLFYQK